MNGTEVSPALPSPPAMSQRHTQRVEEEEKEEEEEEEEVDGER